VQTKPLVTYKTRRPSTHTLHPSNGDKKIWALQYFNQFVEDYPFIISRSGLQIFFEYLLGITNGLKG